MKVTHLTNKNPNTNLNEDSLLTQANVFGVFDGATGLKPYKNADNKTGGYLASSITKDTFRELALKMNLHDCAIKANRRVLAEMQRSSVDLQAKENLWCTTAAAVRINSDDFEWIGIGDSPILIVYKDGKVKVLYHDDLDRETIKLAHSMASKMTGNALKLNGLRKEIMPQIIAVRQKSNIDYGIINGEPAMVNFLRGGTESLSNIKYILLLTDGLLLPKTDPVANEEFDLMATLFQNEGLPGLLKEVRSRQNEDPLCQKYPRLKQYDDATGIAIEIE
ncbi:MAG: protein phosphatase 2C domain-containing protein [Candidatus Komeilibacteria bacterium]|nr:protein phosphatase 2C domain-containing protein [Candidatus Komeilibacteria bacterium]